MRHPKTLRVRVIYAFFIGLSASWMLIVLNATGTWDFYQAWGLAFLGAAMIAALGLRIKSKLDARWFISDCNSRPRPVTAGGNDCLESYQIGHRQPYFSPRVN